MGVPRDLLRDEPGIGEWAILHAWRGSVAHGMYVPSSDPSSIDDKDTMAICVPPLDHYYGLTEYGSRGTREIMRGEWKDEAARLFRRAEEVYDRSTLPAKPDRERIEALCVEVVRMALDSRPWPESDPREWREFPQVGAG